MSSGLKVYYDLMSQPSRAVCLFLKVTGVPFEEKPVALRRGEHLTPEYGEINALHLVPAIDDNGFKLSESIAIMKYVISTHNVPDSWFPSDPKKRAKVEEYLNWYHLNTRYHAAYYFRTKIIEPRMKNIPVNEEKLRAFQSNLEITLDSMESNFLKDNLFLCGNEITIADIMAICELFQTYLAGYDVTENRPKLKAWMALTKQRLQPYFDETHAVVYKAITSLGGIQPKI